MRRTQSKQSTALIARASSNRPPSQPSQPPQSPPLSAFDPKSNGGEEAAMKDVILRAFPSRCFFGERSLFPAWHTTGMCVVLRRPCVEFRYLKLMIILERRNLLQRVWTQLLTELSAIRRMRRSHKSLPAGSVITASPSRSKKIVSVAASHKLIRINVQRPTRPSVPPSAIVPAAGLFRSIPVGSRVRNFTHPRQRERRVSLPERQRARRHNPGHTGRSAGAAYDDSPSTGNALLRRGWRGVLYFSTCSLWAGFCAAQGANAGGEP